MTGTGKRDRNDGRRPLGNRVTRPEPCKCEWTERTGPYRVPTPGNALCQTPGQTTQDTRTHRHLRNLLQSFDLMLGAQRTTPGVDCLGRSQSKQADEAFRCPDCLLLCDGSMLLLNPHSDHLGHLHPTCCATKPSGRKHAEADVMNDECGMGRWSRSGMTTMRRPSETRA
jgi:hypothetical protein